MTQDAAAEVIAIRQAAQELRECIAPMHLTLHNAERIRDCISQIARATHNLNTWLNDQKVL